MFRRTFLLTAAAVLMVAFRAHGTTYAPVTFDELVARADVIFVGEVTDVRSYPVSTRDGTIVKTRVFFRVSDPLWGVTSAVETFDFLGGHWGNIDLAVGDMPTFAVGERRVVFARRETSINPIVGFTQGLLAVTRDLSGVERVLTLQGVPVGIVEGLGATRQGLLSGPVTPMRLSDFQSRIRRALEGRR
jgi:hypothetical protein